MAGESCLNRVSGALRLLLAVCLLLLALIQAAVPDTRDMALRTAEPRPNPAADCLSCPSDSQDSSSSFEGYTFASLPGQLIQIPRGRSSGAGSAGGEAPRLLISSPSAPLQHVGRALASVHASRWNPSGPSLFLVHRNLRV